MKNEAIRKALRWGGIDVRRYRKEFVSLYNKYKDYTMVNEEAFVANLDLAMHTVNVPGDIVECGVWKGGAIAAIAELTGGGKKIHLFDSFEGLPAPQPVDGAAALQWKEQKNPDTYYNNCTADESFVKEAMRLAGVDNYVVYKGWFEKTLSNYPGNAISLLRLDGDWYESTLICLNTLSRFVAPGGIIVIDDYYTWEGCAKAVHQFLAEQPTLRLQQHNNLVAFIQKPS